MTNYEKVRLIVLLNKMGRVISRNLSPEEISELSDLLDTNPEVIKKMLVFIASGKNDFVANPDDLQPEEGEVSPLANII